MDVHPNLKLYGHSCKIKIKKNVENLNGSGNAVIFLLKKVKKKKKNSTMMVWLL